ncbi:TonB-dependent receptor [Acanthopleuribacter pedis]|uniref:TonB-dependent receptor n=1 Tax=Acanthopleuribacter pedis TaxID=442870 RepID=A0A8J7Q8G3_9BACT|nr:TonB-dependent receptor [Acanthopleuribacter pedis]MBO1320416.1 TonB-dependent receptor [Acanthopleuribacter pedis]
MRHPLILCVLLCLATCAGFVLNVMAQEPEQTTTTQENSASDEDSEIHVDEAMEIVGIRRSLTTAAEIKQLEVGVVDAITAEGIGRFPDTNLAESMQRIPGVSIDRRNNEGNQVSVRGFGPSFNLVLLNGRQMPAAATQKQEGDSTAEQSRAFNFAEISPDSIAGVKVYKSTRASVTTGGIGATVDVNTARPFELGKRTLVGSFKGMMDQSNAEGEDLTPEISFLASDLFFDGKVGAMVTGSYSSRDSRENFVATDGWLRVGDANIDTSAIDPALNPTRQVWLPRNLVVDQSDHERTRFNGQAVLQFAPTTRFKATVDYTMSEYEDTIERAQTGIWFESPNPSGVADRHGTVINPTIQSDPTSNLGALDFQGYSDIVKTENEAIGLNFDWQVADNLNFTLDLHDASSEAQPDGVSSDFLVILSGPLGVSTTVNFDGGDVPTATINDSGVGVLNPSLTDGYDDAAGLRPNIDLLRNVSAKNEVKQAQFSGQWVNLGDTALRTIDFGAAMTDYQIDTAWLFDLGVQGQPACLDCAGFVTRQNTAFQQVFPTTLTFNARGIFNDLVNGLNSVFDLVNTNQHRVSEETTSVYVQFDFDTKIGNKPLKILAGARYERTDVTGTTLQNNPEAMVYISPTEFRARFSEERTAYSLESDYDVFLPSFNANLSLNKNLITRLSYGRSLARPDLNSMKPALLLGDARPGGPYNASQGNPGLEPYLSDNIDLALEYYYRNGSYAALTYFRKWVDNYIVSSITQGTIVGDLGYELTDPNPQDDPLFPANTVGGPDDQVITWDILSFANGESASVDGWEIALQHIFQETGFGAQLNYTLVDGDVAYDTFALGQTVALTGLSDSANLVVFYEKERLKIRAAYNWRDAFLLSTNQLRQADEPVFIEEYGQWDLRFGFDILPGGDLSAFLEGLNVTGEPMKAHGRFENQFLLYADQEPRYNVGLRSRF